MGEHRTSTLLLLCFCSFVADASDFDEIELLQIRNTNVARDAAVEKDPALANDAVKSHQWIPSAILPSLTPGDVNASQGSQLVRLDEADEAKQRDESKSNTAASQGSTRQKNMVPLHKGSTRQKNMVALHEAAAKKFGPALASAAVKSNQSSQSAHWSSFAPESLNVADVTRLMHLSSEADEAKQRSEWKFNSIGCLNEPEPFHWKVPTWRELIREVVSIPVLICVIWRSPTFLLSIVACIQVVTHLLLLTSTFRCIPLRWCNLTALAFGFIYMSVAVRSMVAIASRDTDRSDLFKTNTEALLVLAIGSYIVLTHTIPIIWEHACMP